MFNFTFIYFKITSYGGELSFEIYYEGDTDYSENSMKLEIRFQVNINLHAIYRLFLVLKH